MTVEQFFARLAETRVVPELRGVTASYLYQIEGAGQWHVTVDRGAVAVKAGDGTAECIVGADADDFLEAVLGRRNATTAIALRPIARDLGSGTLRVRMDSRQGVWNVLQSVIGWNNEPSGWTYSSKNANANPCKNHRFVSPPKRSLKPSA